MEEEGKQGKIGRRRTENKERKGKGERKKEGK